MNSMFKKVAAMLALLTAMFLLTGVASAAPSFSGEVAYSQPDGTTFDASRYGDEYFNWLDTGDGIALIQDGDGWWCYAVEANGDMTTGARYPQDAVPANAITSARIGNYITVISQSNSVDYSQLASSGAMLGSDNTVVFLVSFANSQIRQSDSYWANKIFGLSGQIPNTSVRQYYRTCSDGKIDIVPAAETSGTANDGVIRVTLSSNHPGSGYTAIDNTVKSVISNTSSYINYSAFDKNGNKQLTSDELHMIFIFAGYEQSYSSATPGIWAHCTTYSAGMIRVNGISVATVSCRVGEYCGSTPTTIGPIAHELGHSLGLIDMYDYDNSSAGVGPYSIMGSGSWGRYSNYGDCPAQLDAYSKVELGIVNPQTANSGTYTVNDQQSGRQNILKITTGKSNEYYLIENREINAYDYSISRYMASGATGGIAVWHIDENLVASGGNDNENHKAVDLVEANEVSLGYSQLDSNATGNYDHLFSANRISTLSGLSTYSGTKLSTALSVVSSAGDSMQVIINNGTGATAAPTATIAPTAKPTTAPTAVPTAGATVAPTARPTATATTGSDYYDNNDTFATASDVIANQDMSATISSSSDVDYFTFTLNKSTRVTLKLQAPASRRYTMTLYNGSQRSLKTATTGTGSSKTVNITLTAGKYYVKVNGYRNVYSTSPYKLGVYASASAIVSDATATATPTAAPTVAPTAAPTEATRTSTAYRALLIGQSNYSGYKNLGIAHGNLTSMYNLFKNQLFAGLSMSSVTALENVGTASILNSISSIASTSSDYDITYFYFTGLAYYSNGVCYLECTDGSVLSTSQLQSALSQIKGYVVVMFDCYSWYGNASASVSVDGSAASFNAAVVAGFATADANVQSSSALSGNKFKIITSCSSDTETGAFAAIMTAAGSDMAADANSDGAVSMAELATYIRAQSAKASSGSAQLPQVYPANDNSVIFSK